MTERHQDRAETDRAIDQIEVIHPSEQTVPFVFASPHSGRRYPDAFLEQSLLDLNQLRQTEDAYVDLLVDMVPQFGAPLLKARFPRAYVDVNRAAEEIDPKLFSGRIPEDSDTKTNRVLAGYGVIPRLGVDGKNLYKGKLPLREAEQRLAACYSPYHTQLRDLINTTVEKFGCAVVIDCHSMPSRGLWQNSAKPRRHVDFILGDRYGTSCAPALLSLTQNLFYEAGYVVTRNAPYAGGFVTQHYGRPSLGVHALQIEINRKLYLDERSVARNAGFEPLRSVLRQIFSELVQVAPYALHAQLAAE